MYNELHRNLVKEEKRKREKPGEKGTQVLRDEDLFLSSSLTRAA